MCGGLNPTVVVLKQTDKEGNSTGVHGLNPTVVVLKLICSFSLSLCASMSQSNRSGFETNSGNLRHQSNQSLNPTVVVLKPASARSCRYGRSRLNPTVVVLKHDSILVRAKIEESLNPTVVVLKHCRTARRTQKRLSQSNRSGFETRNREGTPYNECRVSIQP